MTEPSEQGPAPAQPADRLAQAAAWFTRLRAEDAGLEDLTRFQRWLETDSDNATAYARGYNTNVAIPTFGIPYDTRFLPPNPYTTYVTFKDPYV